MTFTEATIGQYVKWLEGHLAAGGRITHFYDYRYARARFLLAQASFTLDGECGSNSRPIIVPKGVRHLEGARGHNNLYFMKDFSTHGHSVPAYADTEFCNLPGYEEMLEQSRATERRHETMMRVREASADSSDLSRYTTSGRALKTGHAPALIAHADEPVSVYVEPGKVILVPSSLPVTLDPDAAIALAERLIAAANGAR